MNELEKRLLDSATSEEERESIRKILEHERRVNHARSIELFLQGLGSLHTAFREEAREFRKLRIGYATLLLLKVVTAAVMVFGAYLAMRAVLG